LKELETLLASFELDKLKTITAVEMIDSAKEIMNHCGDKK
jgi:hypothetical protein